MPTSSSPNVVAERKAVTQTGRPADAALDVNVPRRFPCVTILIHGVNDLGTDFGTVEGGLCEGLNERLNRPDLKAAEYTHGRMANDDPKKKPVTAADLMKNLDDVLYRRQEDKDTRSPLIPFYWGVRESGKDLPQDPAKQTINGQYVDKFGNRLDVHRAKNGGFFANATTDIPDMFGTHFLGGSTTAILNGIQNDPTHPLFEAPDRHYMVLAAVRLAALIRQIRIINPDETVNIIAHSQGTLISLLAQAFLINGLDPNSCSVGDRPADTLILIDSPYSLEQETMERWTQSGDEQQTSYARVKTLANLTQLVAQAKHSAPSLDTLCAVDAQGKVVRDNFGVTGAKWTPTKAVRLASKPNDDVVGNAALVFAERDNRGKVYLYFCPEDATVALNGVNGMGAAGLPDSMSVRPSRSGAKAESVPLLSNAFRQRIFTRRLRNGQPVLVGNAPGPFTLRLKGESAHGTTGYVETHWKRAEIPVGTVRTINGEALPPPFPPELQGNVIPGTEKKRLDGSASETEPGKQALDQLEAEVAVSTNSSAGALQQVSQTVAWPTFAIGGLVPDSREVESVLNASKDLDNQCRVLRVQPVFPPHAGKLQVLRTETPNEAKVRLMNQLQPDSSYHSGVMSGRRNHRCATAFDVSVGQGRVLDDPILAKLLRSIADWRIPFASLTKGAALERYNQLDHTTREIVEATCRYYGDGTFPSDRLVPKKPPQQVVSEVYKQQQDFKKQEEQRLEKERIDQRNQQLKAQADKVKSTIQQDMDQLQQRLGQGADAARQGVNQAVEQGKQAVKNLIDKF
ncbi:effector protein Tle3 domain-containing protein [Burkholderia theae]|uniref:T6SS effector phospholipase Tle3 domain-containing protein n=1 Tax=Burkholderia theae TaxID=3143496 RepID=UPI003AFB4108